MYLLLEELLGAHIDSRHPGGFTIEKIPALDQFLNRKEAFSFIDELTFVCVVDQQRCVCVCFRSMCRLAGLFTEPIASGATVNKTAAATRWPEPASGWPQSRPCCQAIRTSVRCMMSLIPEVEQQTKK